MEILGYIASLAMGIILGLMGGGGAILTVPIMVYLFRLPPTIATGYSLFVVGVTALIGSSMYIRKGDIDFRTGFFFAVPSIVGVNISRGLIVPAIPTVILEMQSFTLTKEILVMGTFAILMIVASYSMIAKRKERIQVQARSFWRTSLIAIEGLIVGVIAGFVGAGGGFLIIPVFVMLAGLSMRIAVGTSLMVIALQSLIGFSGDLSRGVSVDWILLSSVAAVAVFGIIAGSTFAHKIKEQNLKTSFGWFVLVMGAVILLEQVHQLSSK